MKAQTFYPSFILHRADFKSLVQNICRGKILSQNIDAAAFWAAVFGTLFPFIATEGAFAIFFEDNSWHRFHTALVLCFNAAFSVWLAALLFSIPAGIFRVTSFNLLGLYMALFTFVAVVHLNLYNQVLGVPSLYAVAQTNQREALEFIQSLSPGVVFLGVVLAVLPLIALIYAGRARFCTRKWTCLSCIVSLPAVAYVGVYKFSENNPVFFSVWTASELFLLRSDAPDVSKLGAKHNVSLSFPAPVPQNITHVLILGESTTSKHMSLYGYKRRTNPELESIRNQIYVQEDACSSRGATVPALKEIFSFADRDHEDLLYTEPSLLQMMQAAGFHVYWLSNQQAVGTFDSWVGKFVSDADYKLFINRRGYEDGLSLDGLLLPELKKALSDENNRRFIVLHLIGAHSNYFLRFPTEFGSFDTEQKLPPPVLEHRGLKDYLFRGTRIERNNAYDNALLYNDHIVASAIDMVRSFGGNYSVTYLSDHGEAVMEQSSFFGHIDAVAPKQVYQIPLMFDLSQSVKDAIGDEGLHSFDRNLKKEFESTGMIHTLMQLYGFRHPRWQSQKSLFSADYTSWRRFCDNLQ